MSDSIEVRYYVNGNLDTKVMEPDYPRDGDQICLDGIYYIVASAIRYISMLPPWVAVVHLRVSDREPLP